MTNNMNESVHPSPPHRGLPSDGHHTGGRRGCITSTRDRETRTNRGVTNKVDQPSRYRDTRGITDSNDTDRPRGSRNRRTSEIMHGTRRTQLRKGRNTDKPRGYCYRRKMTATASRRAQPGHVAVGHPDEPTRTRCHTASSGVIPQPPHPPQPRSQLDAKLLESCGVDRVYLHAVLPPRPPSLVAWCIWALFVISRTPIEYVRSLSADAPARSLPPATSLRTQAPAAPDTPVEPRLPRPARGVLPTATESCRKPPSRIRPPRAAEREQSGGRANRGHEQGPPPQAACWPNAQPSAQHSTVRRLVAVMSSAAVPDRPFVLGCRNSKRATAGSNVPLGGDPSREEPVETG